MIRSLMRKLSNESKSAHKIRVVGPTEDDKLMFSFKYSSSSNISFKAPKNEKVQMVLTRIKRMVQLQLQKEELNEIDKFSCSKNCEGKDAIDTLDVFLQSDSVIDMTVPNIEAWSQASKMSVGGIDYEVTYNIPYVRNLSLPEFIIPGCIIRPHCLLECATFNDSIFTWYRSITKDDASKLKLDPNTKILNENENYWLRIHEGLFYSVSFEDIGCLIRVICTPKQNKLVGLDCSVQSKTTIEAMSNKYPFEERQEYTKLFCKDSSIRCLSYNVLANVYVEKKKFPYASCKARDIYYRKQILLRELIGYKSDIICLQEVQEGLFVNDLLPLLSQQGYTGFYTRKIGHNEGLATFYLPSKFKMQMKDGILLNKIIKEKHIYMDLINKVGGNYKDMSKLLAQSTVLQVLSLEHIHLPKKKLLVANTHLYAQKDMPEVRLIQAAICTNYIEHIIKEEDLESAAILFCGDFNSLPHSSTYDFMMNGTYKCCPSWRNSKQN
ncbi:glucose-repressible alcohol dehydrogenase transcriptional effector [Trichonephila inaurata madagascariensis]|uniref:Glucose-repressible alcohol dehydrogenase transcriptional effector n=1 Tax=Trichonephila inaurata madagascariensis TaxID=2747483 RepID=A0A8X6XBB6_9ARAC|nr:glucose-repressible alcohol dehydrogenase transcriptional effector [Trichonephila inaurata madagascariensis]